MTALTPRRRETCYFRGKPLASDEDEVVTIEAGVEPYLTTAPAHRACWLDSIAVHDYGVDSDTP